MKPVIGDPHILLPPHIVRDSVIDVRAQLSHPMFTGMSRNPDGSLIPAFYVKTVVVRYGGEEVARFEWTSGISKDPYVSFPLRATREGPLTIEWLDTHGGRYHQSADITFDAA